LYNYYQSVVVAFYIEYVSLVANAVNTFKVFLYIGVAFPFGSFGRFVPMFQWYFSFFVLSVEIE
jgi:hypothetical protein